MPIKFIAPAVLVRNIAVSKNFYATVMDQEIDMDNGRHVSFKGFSLWEYEYAHGVIFNAKISAPEKMKPQAFELYFETDELDEALDKLVSRNVELIHGIHEHPWGQRGFRINDPDGHIIEISEPLSAVVKRFVGQGMSLGEIADKTSMPEAMVKAMAGE